MSAASAVVRAPPSLTFLDLLPPGSPQSPETTVTSLPSTGSRFSIALDQKEQDGIRIHVYLLFYEDHALLWSMLEQAFVEMEETRLNRALAWLEEIEAVEIEPVPAPNPWSAEDALVSLVPHPSPPSSSATSSADYEVVNPKLPLPWPGSHVHSPMHPATPGPLAGLALLPVLLSEQEYRAETSAAPSEMASHVSKTPRRRHPQTPGGGATGGGARGGISRESRSRPSRSTLDMTALASTEGRAPTPSDSQDSFLILNDAASSVPAQRPTLTSSKSVTILDHPYANSRPASSASMASYPPPPAAPPALTHSQSTPSFNPSSRFENMRFIPLLGGGGITTHAAEALNPLSNNYSFLADFRRAQVTPPSSDWWVSETTTPYLGPTEAGQPEERNAEAGLALDLGTSSHSSGDMDALLLDAGEIDASEGADASPATGGHLGHLMHEDDSLHESLLHASAKEVTGASAAQDWRHRISSQQGGANLDDRPVGVLLHSKQAAQQQQENKGNRLHDMPRSRRASANQPPASDIDPRG